MAANDRLSSEHNPLFRTRVYLTIRVESLRGRWQARKSAEIPRPTFRVGLRVTLVTCVTRAPGPILEKQALPLCALEIE